MCKEAANAKRKAKEAKAACEKVATAAHVAQFEAKVKARTPVGEMIVALGSDSDIGSRVSLVG